MPLRVLRGEKAGFRTGICVLQTDIVVLSAKNDDRALDVDCGALEVKSGVLDFDCGVLDVNAGYSASKPVFF